MVWVFSQCIPTSECTGTELSFSQLSVADGRLGGYNVLPLACWAQRALTQALLSVKGPRQSSWQHPSRIPSDYRNIWTNLNLRPRNNYFFPSEMEREQSVCTEKCHWSEANIKRCNIVFHHLYSFCFFFQISSQLNMYDTSTLSFYFPLYKVLSW